MPKTRETQNAIFYEQPSDSAALIAAIMGAVTQTTEAFKEKQKKKESMKEVWAQLKPEQQQALFDAWSPKERKFYSLTPRAKTDVEIAQDTTTKSQAIVAQAEAGRQPLLTAQLQQQVDAGKIELEKAQRMQSIINDPKADLWDKAYAEGHRGKDAEDYVLRKKYPEVADQLLQIDRKIGPEYEKQMTGEYFQQLQEKMGNVDPVYTLKTAQALAQAVARQDISGLNELNKDPKWPKAMQTLAKQRYQLDVDQLNESRKQRVEASNQTAAQLSLRLMEQFPGDVGPTTALSAAQSLLKGERPAGWAQEKFNQGLASRKAVEATQRFDLSSKIAERVQGISEFRSSIDTLRRLDPKDPKIPKLKEEMLQRMARLYNIPKEEFEDQKGMWRTAMETAYNFTVAGTQAGVALAGDAAAGISARKSLDERLMADPKLGTAGQAGGGMFEFRTPPGGGPSQLYVDPSKLSVSFGDGSLKLTNPAAAGRSNFLAQSARTLIDEFGTASPERRTAIRELLAAIAADPDGEAALAGAK